MADIVKGSRELLLVAERMAMDKGIQVESIISAMEDGIKMAARKKYGHDLEVECIIDKKTGNITLYNILEVVADDKIREMNHKTQITLSDAVEKAQNGQILFQENIEVGGTVKVELPPIDLSRLVVQVARTEITKKIREAEKEKEFNDFINKVGTIVNGSVKKIGIKNIVVEVDGHETLLSNDNLIPGEYFRVGDRIRAYVADVVRSNDNQISLSRTDNNFLAELMKQEVVEIYDGLIEIRGVARDPGSKAKVAVYSKDNINNLVGICVGPRGSKIQAVSSELRGEKIDVIEWSEDRAEFTANLLSPANVSKVIVNDLTGITDVVVPQDQFNLAIGRSGQNIKLVQRIIGGKINILTEEEEKEKRATEFNDNTNLFMEALDVEEVIAQLLVADGYSSIEEIAEASVEDLQKIEGFDEDVATEIRNRAIEYFEDDEYEEEQEDNDNMEE
ncbi:MAG: transcription termination factor NusA [Rickettsiales bacterium]|nr:transcription termination factor NusA [Rickettsiales bacterium]